MISRCKLFTLLCSIYISDMNSCPADLGETIDQMILRYGNPIPEKSYYVDHPDEPVGYLFVKNPYVITANFRNGVVSSEVISKKDHSSFSDAEIANLLNNNSLANQAWTGPIMLYKAKRWTRGDGAIVTYAFGRGPFLIVELHPIAKKKKEPGTINDST